MLLVSCGFALFLPGCRNTLGPQNVPDKEASNAGTLTLAIVRQGTARTIAPDISADDFARFRLEFAVAEECESENENFYNIWEGIAYGTIQLDTGIWDLTVTAYMDEGEDESNLVAMAAGRLRVDISDGGEIMGSVALAPLTEGQGTFTWNIGFDEENLRFARMSVTRIDGEDPTPFGNPFLFGGNPLRGRTDSENFNAGQYRVVVVLERFNGDRAELRTILHIYRDKTSHFEMTFTDEHFGVDVLDYILSAWPNPRLNFYEMGITAGALSFAGISGVNDDNFADVVRWFDSLSSSTGLHPTNLADLRRLTDAALIGVAIDGFESFENRAQVREAILERVKNNTATPTISWLDDNMSMVHIGGYYILFDIPIPPTSPPPGMLTVEAQFAWLRANAQSYNYYLIRVDRRNDMIPAETLLPAGRTNLTITLRGTEQMQTIALFASGVLFIIDYGVTFILGENITLQGRNNNTNHLVRVNNGGTLIMNTGARITGNRNATNLAENGGGGVRVNSGGVFILDGGEISGNSTSNTVTTVGAPGHGGGVRVESGGRFDMLSGTISGNTGLNGGGVWNQGIFRMSGGVVYGNETTVLAGLRNTSRTVGSASLNNAGTAQRGTFNAGGAFTSLGTLGTINYTIRLANGLGQPTGVTVSPAAVSVPTGGTRSFTATVAGLFSPPQGITWSIVEPSAHAQTTIINGVLSIAIEENLAALTVRATSTFDNSIYGEANITVLQRDQDGNVIVPGVTLASQLAWLRENASSGDSYLVELNENDTIVPTAATTGVNQSLPTGRTNLTIVLRGVREMRSVSLSANGSHFWIPSSVTLVLDEYITLQGRNSNTNHLVRINSGGTLIMNTGARITGNENTTTAAANGGGGVRVNSGGVFILDGGEISGNSTTNTNTWTEVNHGGGVRVESGGRFDMLSGTISGNTGLNGGGVWNQGIFRMSGGVVYGNEATVLAGLRNTSRAVGSASLSNAGTAQRGTFNAGGAFTSLGMLGTSSNTIMLKDGVFQMIDGDLAARLAWLRYFAQSNGEYIVEISDNETIAPTFADTGANQALPTGRTNLTIILRGVGGMRSVSLSAHGSLFGIPSGVTLVLDQYVTLGGHALNTNHLVRVNSGGTLIMNEGSRITGNQNTTTIAVNGGGGVRVNSGGVFILDGGEISGNSTTTSFTTTGNGGGVHIEWNGRFDMLSGTISGNAGQNGGGVWNQGTFQMSGGVVYGNEAAVDSTLRNTSRTVGSASLSNTGTAQRGTFDSGGAFTSLGSLTTTNNTIRLVNGLGQPTGVTVSPATVSVPTGGTQNFTATVAGLFAPQTVVWSIVEPGVHAQTTITNGFLSVAAGENLAALTVRATSAFNGSVVYGEAAVTVLQTGPISITVTGISTTHPSTSVEIELRYPETVTRVASGSGNISGSSATFTLWDRNGDHRFDVPGNYEVSLRFGCCYECDGEHPRTYRIALINITSGTNTIPWSVFSFMPPINITVTGIPSQYHGSAAEMILMIPGTMNDAAWVGDTYIPGSSITFTLHGASPGIYDVMFVDTLLFDGADNFGMYRAPSRSITAGTNSIPWSAFASVPPSITITLTGIPAEYRDGFGGIELECAMTGGWADWSRTEITGASATFSFWFASPGTYDVRLWIKGSNRWGEAVASARNITATSIIPWSAFHFTDGGETMPVTVTGIPERYHGDWGDLDLYIPGTSNHVARAEVFPVGTSTTFRFRLRDVEPVIYDVILWLNDFRVRYILLSRNITAGTSIPFTQFTLAPQAFSGSLGQPERATPSRSRARLLKAR